jgi:hypothetical protein
MAKSHLLPHTSLQTGLEILMSSFETTDPAAEQRTTDVLIEHFDLIKVIPHTCYRSGHKERNFFKILLLKKICLAIKRATFDHHPGIAAKKEIQS